MRFRAAPTGPPATGAAASARSTRAALVVYVEGPRDRDLLQSWARNAAPRLVRPLVEGTVILGGRQPARAATHLRRLRGGEAAPRGICVLDHDGVHAPEPDPDGEPGLEFFTWGRRHIESYLLVPDAIRRGHRVRDRDGRLVRRLREELPTPDDEPALRRIDAKRLLARKGPVSRALGRPVAPGRIARAMRGDEIHADVHALFRRIGERLGLADPVVREIPVTVRRGRTGSSG